VTADTWYAIAVSGHKSIEKGDPGASQAGRSNAAQDGRW